MKSKQIILWGLFSLLLGFNSQAAATLKPATQKVEVQSNEQENFWQRTKTAYKKVKTKFINRINKIHKTNGAKGWLWVGIIAYLIAFGAFGLIVAGVTLGLGLLGLPIIATIAMLIGTIGIIGWFFKK